MNQDTRLLYTFLLGEKGDITLLGSHGAFIDGKTNTGTVSNKSTIDVIIIAVTITNVETNAAKAEFAHALRYPITNYGTPLVQSSLATEIPLTILEKNLYAMKASLLLGKNI
jgi:hypothetical protein